MNKKVFITAATLILLVIVSVFLLSGNKGQAPSPSSVNGSSSKAASDVSGISSSSSSGLPDFSSQPSENSDYSSLPSDDTGFNANNSGLPIILFHHFLRDEYKKGNKNVITQSESEFESQIKALYDNGYKALTLNEAVSFLKGEKKIPPKSVLLTFDDGYKSNAVIAAPILRKYGFTAVLFVMTGGLDYPDEEYNPLPNAFQYINRTDMENSRDVFTYACHSDEQHVDYTKTARSIVVPDLLRCKEKLSGSDVMAYPIGKYNQAVIQLMKELNFKYCFTTERKHAKPGVDLYAIPRFTISAGTTVEQFMKVVETGRKE